MPGEFGTFLALTGTPFTGEEATGVLGLSDHILNWNEEMEDHIKTVSGLSDLHVTAKSLYDTDGINENVYNLRGSQLFLEQVEHEELKEKHSEAVKDIFKPIGALNRRNAEEINEEIDLRYKHYLRENIYQKAIRPTLELGSGATGHYLNHYQNFADLYLQHLEFEGCYTKGSFLKHHEMQINRCFFGDSIEEIKENLRSENTKFSKYCLDRMEKMDPLALNVTLSLLRKSAKGSYSECCHYELKAMLNMLKNQHRIDKDTPMTSEFIEEFFNTPEEYKNVDVHVPEHSALPTRFYYRKYADHLRLMMNEHTSSNSAIREGYDRELQSELRELGIDIRDTGADAQTVRTNLWKVEQAERAVEHNKNMQGYFLNDEKISENFYADVATRIEQLNSGNQWDDDHTDYYSLINDKVQKSFNDALMKNVEMMLEKNQDLHGKFKRKRFLLKLKKFFFENRLLVNQPQKDLIESERLQQLPSVPLTFSEDIYDNIYDSFSKFDFNTIGDYEEFMKPSLSFYNMNKIYLDENFHKKRLVISNGHDPYTESKYWDEYIKMKELREKVSKKFVERHNTIKEFNKQYFEATLTPEQIKESQKRFIDEYTGEELAVPEFSTEKNLNFKEHIDKCIKSHSGFSSFLDDELNLSEKEPLCAEIFKKKFKNLLTKYVQIAVLNHANGSSKKSLDFMTATPTRNMSMIDSFLSDKVNTNATKRIMDNVTPALNITMNKIIEEEARKILYSLNYQDNVSHALAHLYGARANPENVKAKWFVDAMTEEFKDDPEVSQYLEARPTNVMMAKGFEASGVLRKVTNKISSLSMENPIEALQAYCESIGFYDFDPSLDDPHQKAEIEQNLVKNLGDLENPIEDSIQYGMTLLMAHESLKFESPTTRQNAIESCAQLLGGSKDANYEVSQLLRETNSTSTSHLRNESDKEYLYDFLDMNCDVESLSQIWEKTKSLSSKKDVKKVLGYVNNSLAQTSDARRKNITLKEFFENDSQINFKFIENAADTLLKEKAKKVAQRAVTFREADIDIDSIDLLSSDVKKMISDDLQYEKERVIDIDTFEPYSRKLTSEDVIDTQIRKDIQSAISMSDDLEFTRARTENELIKAYTFGEKSTKEINDIIQEWIDIRVLDLKSKPEYKHLNDSEFKNTMIETFRENVINEIGLTKMEGNIKTFHEMFEVDERDWNAVKNDVANKNTLNIIMQDAVGYDRIIERLQDPSNSADIAHQNLAEKLLGEYYINKRNDYKASQELLEVLNQNFNSSTIFQQGIRSGIEVDRLKGNYTKSSKAEDGLSEFDGIAEKQRKDVELMTEDMYKLIDLGTHTNYAIQGDTQGISEKLLKIAEKGEEWEGKLCKFDRRRSSKQWIEEKLEKILNELFSARERIEKNAQINSGYGGVDGETMVLDRQMTRNELKAFDKDLVKHLNKDNMIERLLFELDKEYSEMNQIRTQSKLKRHIELDEQIQKNKHKNEQELYNRSMKNEDAAYKLIAYRIAKSIHPDREKPKPETHIDYFYEKQLQRDIMESPRDIIPEEYRTKIKKEKSPNDVNEEDFSYREYESYLRDKDVTNKMYQRVDVKYLLDQYQVREDAQNRATNVTKQFLREFYKDSKKDMWFK